MRLMHSNSAAVASAGIFLILGVATGAAQTTNPDQNAGTPTLNGAPNFPGQSTLNNGNTNTKTTSTPDDPGSPSAPSGKATGQRFAKGAAIGGMTEVQLGQLAVQKASNDKVKQFGQRMVDDHGKACQELKAIAARNNMMLPTALDAKHKAMVDKLSALSGEQFDRAYVSMMVKDHNQDVNAFQGEVDNGTVPDLKTWAARTLPTLQDHDRIIKQIKSEMNTKISQR